MGELVRRRRRVEFGRGGQAGRARPVVIVEIVVAQRDAMCPLADQIADAVPGSIRQPMMVETRGRPAQDAAPLFEWAQ